MIERPTKSRGVKRLSHALLMVGKNPEGLVRLNLDKPIREQVGRQIDEYMDAVGPACESEISSGD